MQEEINVCYECLKHSLEKMDTCSSCYFALLCSEICNQQHRDHRCVVEIRQSLIIQKQNNLSKNNKSMKIINENVSYISPTSFTEETNFNSMIIIYSYNLN